MCGGMAKGTPVLQKGTPVVYRAQGPALGSWEDLPPAAYLHTKINDSPSKTLRDFTVRALVALRDALVIHVSIDRRSLQNSVSQRKNLRGVARALAVTGGWQKGGPAKLQTN
eukprot:1178370-Prorocentrum_minimum.AAC.11